MQERIVNIVIDIDRVHGAVNQLLPVFLLGCLVDGVKMPCWMVLSGFSMPRSVWASCPCKAGRSVFSRSCSTMTSSAISPRGITSTGASLCPGGQPA